MRRLWTSFDRIKSFTISSLNENILYHTGVWVVMFFSFYLISDAAEGHNLLWFGSEMHPRPQDAGVGRQEN
jgi:hypothetical protein